MPSSLLEGGFARVTALFISQQSKESVDDTLRIWVYFVGPNHIA